MTKEEKQEVADLLREYAGNIDCVLYRYMRTSEMESKTQRLYRLAAELELEIEDED